MCWCFYLLFFPVQSLSCALKWSIDSISMEIMPKFWTDKRSHCEITMLLHMVRISNAFVRYHSFLICISAHSSVFFYSIASISFLCGYSFWIVHFYLREKKTVAILTFEFFVFVIRFAWKVWWLVTNHKKCVYTRKIEIYRKLIAIWQRTLLFKLRHKVHFNKMPAGNVRLNWMAFSWRTKFHSQFSFARIISTVRSVFILT